MGTHETFCDECGHSENSHDTYGTQLCDECDCTGFVEAPEDGDEDET